MAPPDTTDVGAASTDHDLIKKQRRRVGSQLPATSGFGTCNPAITNRLPVNRTQGDNDSKMFVFPCFYQHTTLEAVPNEESYNIFGTRRAMAAPDC